MDNRDWRNNRSSFIDVDNNIEHWNFVKSFQFETRAIKRMKMF